MTILGRFDDLENAGHRYEANRLLFKCLSDDDERAALYRSLLQNRRVLRFQSRAGTKLRPTDDAVSKFHQDVYLLSARADVERALTDSDCFSNSPYQALGSGTFMLGLDGADHDAQRAFASACLGDFNATIIAALSTVAFQAAAVLPLKRRQFDLVDLAEQSALRFVAFLFGFAQADHPLIEATMRAAYLGLNYQILGRHFVSQPFVITEAAVGMGALLQRVAYLIDLYRERIGREQEDEYATIDAELRELRAYADGRERHPLERFVPLLKRIGEHKGAALNYSGSELAVIVVGLIAGTIGNVQAGVSIAINGFFDPANQILQTARDAAARTFVADPDAAPVTDPELQALVREALRLNPPVAFLPRKTLNEIHFAGGAVPANRVVILAIGGATRDGPDQPDKFDPKRTNYDRIYPLIFGGPPPPPAEDSGQGETRFMHQCIGERVSMPLITHIVREVLVLPELVESVDPLTAMPARLRKLWGFNCQTYPMEFHRFKILKHTPLNVIMNVKMPISEHAEKLKLVIKYGAPRIEKKLRDAKHVHFAQFMFLENDTKLALLTWYDRDLDSYIEHFALQVGPLFDRIFEHIEDAPPLPVNQYPKEFVDTIRRYNARPAAGYLFSAYPLVEASMITNHFTRKNR